MFKAIARLFATVGYIFTGNIDALRKSWSKSPAAIRAKGDSIVQKKKARAMDLEGAITGLVRQRNQKKNIVAQKTEEIVKLQTRKKGALAECQRIASHKNLSEEQAAQDPEYIEAINAYKTYLGQESEKNADINRAQADFNRLQDQVTVNQTSLANINREIEKAKEMVEGTIADVISAEEQNRINRALSGMSGDDSQRELDELREMRENAVASVEVTGTLAGTQTSSLDAKYEAAGIGAGVVDEFAGLIKFAKKAEKASVAVSSGDKLPEH